MFALPPKATITQEIQNHSLVIMLLVLCVKQGAGINNVTEDYDSPIINAPVILH
jgi:hypothetical protein